MNNDEREELVNDISKSLQSQKNKKDKKPEDRDNFFSFEIPLDEVLPPSNGHEVGERVPNTSSYNQPYNGGFFIEGIEERLLRLLENVNVTDNDFNSSESGNKSVDAKSDNRPGQKQVGTTEALECPKASKDPTAQAKTQQQENSPFTKREKVINKTVEDQNKDSEEMLQNAIDDLGISGETQSTIN